MMLPTYISAFLVVFGGWVRYLIKDNTDFYWITIGALIQAAGQSFMMSGAPKLAVIWFGDNERSFCTTLGSLSFPFGSILGFAMPLLFFHHMDIT